MITKMYPENSPEKILYIGPENCIGLMMQQKTLEPFLENGRIIIEKLCATQALEDIKVMNQKEGVEKFGDTDQLVRLLEEIVEQDAR